MISRLSKNINSSERYLVSMSNSDYTTIGKSPIVEESPQEVTESKDSDQSYIYSVDNYSLLSIITSCIFIVVSIIAMSYAVFMDVSVKNTISVFFIFGAIFITCLFYLIDMYKEYKSWSKFGEELHAANVKIWNGENVEYPQLNKSNVSLWRTAFPSCVVLIFFGTLLFFINMPLKNDQESEPGGYVTTTVTVPGEGAKEVVINPKRQNQPPIVVDQPTSSLIEETTIESTLESTGETTSSNTDNVTETSQEDRTSNDHRTKEVTGERRNNENEGSIDSSENNNSVRNSTQNTQPQTGVSTHDGPTAHVNTQVNPVPQQQNDVEEKPVSDNAPTAAAPVVNTGNTGNTDNKENI